MCLTNCTPSRCRTFLFHFTWWNVKSFMFFEPSAWTAAGLFTRGRLLGYAVDDLKVEATDSSSTLTSSSSLPSCSVTFWTQSNTKFLKAQPLSFWFCLWCIFFKYETVKGRQLSHKEHKFLSQFHVYPAAWTIVQNVFLPLPRLA